MDHGSDAPPCTSRAGKVNERPWPPGLKVLAPGLLGTVECELRLWQRHLFTLYGPVPRELPVRIAWQHKRHRRSARAVARKLRRWGYRPRLVSPKCDRKCNRQVRRADAG